MFQSIFITGYSGFIGRYLFRTLESRKYKSIYCLSRRNISSTDLSRQGNYQFIRAGIHDTDAYSPYLRECDVVIHMAAATGKSKPQDLFNVNLEGTRVLVEKCRQLHVKNFLYVSSIAVKFPNTSQYPYARSKQRAEDVVRESDLRYAIIRPTIVLGQEGPIWQSLFRLAKVPVILIPGDGKES